jgi:hypothetical protein
MNDNVISGFENLTYEQCIEMSVRHVHRTGKKSRESKGGGVFMCSYRGVGCAAAPFLTPEARNKLEGAWDHLVAKELVPGFNGRLIQTLQSCHDGSLSSTPAQFRDNFDKNIKDHFGENAPGLDEPWNLCPEGEG